MTSQFNENVNLLSQVLRSSKHAGKRIAYTGKFNPVDGTLTASRDTIPDKNQAWVRLDPKGIAIPAWHNHKFDVAAIDLAVYVDYNPAGELEVTDLMNSDISVAYGSAAPEVTTPQVIVKNNSTILKESIDILRPTRSGLGGLKVRVSGYLSPYGNFLTQDVDFDGQQPSTSGVRRWAIAYLDTTTLDIAFALGDETPANEATRNDIPGISLPRVAIPIAAMSMYDGMTQYIDSELVDIRPFLTLKGDDVIFYQLLLVDSIEMIQRNAIDFLAGSGIAIVGTDNPGDDSTEIEISLDIGLNAKGDLLTSDGDDLTILPVGANNTILTADDTAPSGLAYKNTIDGVTIGGTTPAAGTFTTLQTTASLGVGGTPSVRFHVHSTSVNAAIIQTNQAQSWLWLQSSGASAFSSVGIGGNENDLWLRSGGALKAVLNSDGKLAVNHTSPSAFVDISQGSTSDAAINIRRTGFKTWSIGNQGTGFRILNVTDSIEGLFIDQAGQVGIGTISPARKLDVDGVIRASGDIITTSANGFRVVSGNFGLFFRNDGNNFFLLSTASGDQYGSWNSLRPFRANIATGDVSLGNDRLYVQHLGNVGIGINTPERPLEVRGNYTGDLRTVIRVRNTNNTTAAVTHMSLEDASGNSTGLQHSASTYTGIVNYANFGVLSNDHSGLLIRAGNASGIIRFLTGGIANPGNSRLLIAADGHITATQSVTTSGGFSTTTGTNPIGDWWHGGNNFYYNDFGVFGSQGSNRQAITFNGWRNSGSTWRVLGIGSPNNVLASMELGPDGIRFNISEGHSTGGSGPTNRAIMDVDGNFQLLNGAVFTGVSINNSVAHTGTVTLFTAMASSSYLITSQSTNGSDYVQAMAYQGASGNPLIVILVNSGLTINNSGTSVRVQNISGGIRNLKTNWLKLS